MEQLYILRSIVLSHILINLTACCCVQEPSGRRKIVDLEQQLQSSEALVADYQRGFQQRDSELEALRAKVTTDSLGMCIPNPANPHLVLI